jgi:hypothetical protein
MSFVDPLIKENKLMKECPFCSEEIKDDAMVCTHCGRVLTTVEMPRPKRPAGRTAAIGVGFLLLSFLCAAIQGSMQPSTQMEALIPGIIIGLLGWVAIILFIVAIVQVFLNRLAK